MSKTWIQTSEDRALEVRSLTVDMVGSIEEIARSLSRNNRFTRQTARAYSVAEHCVRGAQELPLFARGAFLLHELSEVYLPDIAGPLKPFVRVVLDGEGDAPGQLVTWEELERQHTHVMLVALGLTSIEPMIYSPEVKRMDLAMLAWEKRDLMGPEPKPWLLGVEPPPAAVRHTIDPWGEERAFASFLSTFRAIF